MEVTIYKAHDIFDGHEKFFWIRKDAENYTTQNELHGDVVSIQMNYYDAKKLIEGGSNGN